MTYDSLFNLQWLNDNMMVGSVESGIESSDRSKLMIMASRSIE